MCKARVPKPKLDRRKAGRVNDIVMYGVELPGNQSSLGVRRVKPVAIHVRKLPDRGSQSCLG